MPNRVLSFIALLLTFKLSFRITIAQEYETQRTNYQIQKVGNYSFLESPIDFFPTVLNIEHPHPSSDKVLLNNVKQEIERKYPRKVNLNRSLKHNQSEDSLRLGRGFNNHPPSNSLPFDNNLAISNEGIFISAINSTLFAYDTNKDSILFHKSLDALAQPLSFTQSKFDPKIIYDPGSDRFILVFLNGSNASSSKIIVGFSSSSDPTDSWNMYALPGNPFNDTTWSDYPAIALTENELFITMNLIKEGVSWQNGFRQTIIWQIEKLAGHAGDSNLSSQLWSNIHYENKPIRNLNPINGGSAPKGPNLYFLSNRNFDLQNDSIFLVEISNTMNNNPDLRITSLKSDLNYGVPPDGRQEASKALATNDARILCGIYENNLIHFAGNTIDTTTGLAAIYYGVISNIEDNPAVRAKIIGDQTKDFAYPNMAYSGEKSCENDIIISFEHTSLIDYAGISAVFINNDLNVSSIIKVKEGLNYILKSSFVSANRWGDYSGSQRKYNEPGKVWISGTFGNTDKKRANWVAELLSPDRLPLSIGSFEKKDISHYRGTDGSIHITPAGGIPPYSYLWNSDPIHTTPFLTNLSSGTYSVLISDQCQNTYSDSFNLNQPLTAPLLFPNPVDDLMHVTFEITKSELCTISIYTLSGHLIHQLQEDYFKLGTNILSFSTFSLASGTYILKIRNNSSEILKQKFIKN